MNISLKRPSVDTMHSLIKLAQEQHDHEVLAFNPEHSQKAFEYLINTPTHGDVFLVHVNQDGHEDIAGFVVICYSFSIEFGGLIAVIDQIFLNKDWRRQGVGSHVLPMLEEQVKQKNCNAIVLEVNIGNGGAREFYEQFNYIPRRQHCIMSKRINS
ncbi:GNAT family N-acetyltransferase [Veronia nyctiphanis]|uniref:GNAT family N-acetyltransferase n=1 Tax=Veronia nyctiphanis TaxID=1278244 RepID=A0A4Q0YYF4_9GAMM|nr:GNAT family N-acetyltransferase [Veronia nyctiphanis]RXJ74249.1 GNAT family N-acetyltransferase [Veronia nyctiphanis]